jgi:hypothetical protein
VSGRSVGAGAGSGGEVGPGADAAAAGDAAAGSADADMEAGPRVSGTVGISTVAGGAGIGCATGAPPAHDASESKTAAVSVRRLAVVPVTRATRGITRRVSRRGWSAASGVSC